MWEFISSTNNGVSTHRMPVPGGWIVMSSRIHMSSGVSVDQIFVPDPTHEWKPE